MASQTDEAERRVREQRALIERKVAALEERVTDDVTMLRTRTKYHVTHATDAVPGAPQLIQQVEEHPTVAMAGGLGLGVMAGMMAGRGSDTNGASRSGYDGRHGGGGDGGSMVGALTSGLLMPLRPYFEEAAKDLISGFKDRAPSSGASRASSPPPAAAPQDQRAPASSDAGLRS